MILKYIQAVYRSIRSNYKFHLVNTSGLTIGLICVLLVLLYAKQELSYDNHHDDSSRIFRVTEKISSAASTREFAATPWPLATALSQKFHQVENVARVYRHFIKIQLTYKENSFYADNFLFAENEILNILSYNFINGDPASALERPNSIILSLSAAEMIFGEAQAYGKSLEINGDLYEITGIIEDQTEPGHLKADFLASLNSVMDEEEMTNWLGTECYTYLKLMKGINRSDFEILIKDIAYDYSGDRIRASGNTIEFFLQEISKIHLSPALMFELISPGNKKVLFLLSSMGIFVLLISILNYINLAVANTIKRNREIGINKSFGAKGSQVISPFFLETVFILLISILVATLVSIRIMPWFTGYFLPVSLNSLLSERWNILFVVLFILIVSSVISIYPAYYVFKIQPASAMKSTIAGPKGLFIRRLMVIIQFVFSTILIIVTIVSSRQIRYMESVDPGYKKDLQLIVRFNGGAWASIRNSPEEIKQIFQDCPGVKKICASSNTPGEKLYSWNVKSLDKGVELNNSIFHLFSDPDFFNIYELEIIAGRSFDYDLLATDIADWSKQTTFVINEAAVRDLGLSSSEQALGLRLQSGLGNIEGEIIGVVKDFHYEGLQNSIAPLIMAWFPQTFKYLTMQIDPSNTSSTLSGIQGKWYELYPDVVFEYYFLSDIIDSQYNAEKSANSIALIFTLAGIIIALVGLIGFSSFVLANRKMETGIRKLLGASTPEIIRSLLTEFIITIIVASAIAFPLAYLLSRSWLNTFAFKIEIGILPFVISFSLSLFLCLLLVGMKAYRLASSNLVDSFRNN